MKLDAVNIRSLFKTDSIFDKEKLKQQRIYDDLCVNTNVGQTIESYFDTKINVKDEIIAQEQQKLLEESIAQLSTMKRLSNSDLTTELFATNYIEEQDTLSALMEEIKNPLGDYDAITKNAIQSKIADFNDEVNQFESLAVNSMNSMVSKVESEIEKTIKQNSIFSGLGCLDTVVNTQDNYISKLAKLAKPTFYEQKSAVDKAKEQIEAFTTSTANYIPKVHNTFNEIIESFRSDSNIDELLKELTGYSTDDITIKESAINYIRNIVFYVEDLLNLIEREFNRKLKSFLSKLTDIKASIKIFIESITIISPSPQYTHFLENLLKQHFFYKLSTTRP